MEREREKASRGILRDFLFFSPFIMMIRRLHESTWKN